MKIMLECGYCNTVVTFGDKKNINRIMNFSCPSCKLELEPKYLNALKRYIKEYEIFERYEQKSFSAHQNQKGFAIVALETK